MFTEVRPEKGKGGKYTNEKSKPEPTSSSWVADRNGCFDDHTTAVMARCQDVKAPVLMK
ncbi:11171_t:CDS:2 [Funneliformis caledonium]|uniref:11171_t:CDS:1 n=1 Tax=Funneliformis caledonium TaxID=1117310 RepID=A0A9N9G6D1_9GLOM|nr:11171_t:CDS:2 [Funneliformis caledonium]